MKIKSIIASLLLACIIPFASVYADDPIISITTLEQLTTFAPAAGNFRLDADLALTANIAFKEGFNLDLNGHTLNVGANVISISGTVTIKDSSANKAGLITNVDKQLFQVNKNRTLNLESGTFVSSNSYAIYGLSGSIVNINGGTVESTSGYAALTIGSLNVNGGTIQAPVNVAIVNQGTVTVNSGLVHSAGSIGIYGQSDSETIVNGGTVKTDADDYAILLSKPGSNLTVNGGEILAQSDAGGVGVGMYKDTSMVMNGGVIRGHDMGITGNGSVSGSNEGSNAKITITGGEVSAVLTGIYAPQPYGETTITGGKISGGDVAIELRAGTLKISGGTFNGGSGDPFQSTPNYSGTTAKNAAVVVAQHTTKLPIDVQITGGVFNAEVPFVENNPQHNDAESIAKISLKISDGDDGVAPVFNATGDYSIFSEDIEGFIYAGRYTHDLPDEYVADEHGEIIESDSMDAVYPYRRAATTADTENGNVEISTEQTLRGTEVTITAQPDPGYVVVSIEVVDANGNNVPVANNKYIAPNTDTTVTVTFGIENPATGDNVFDYGAFMGLCAVALGTAISSIRLARVIRRVL